MRSSAPLAVLAALLSLAACSSKPAELPDVEDAPVLGVAQVKDIPETIPAYGIATEGGIVVNIEASDAARVHAGEPAVAFMLPSTAPVSCRVTRSLRDVSAETNQSLAWLSPVGHDGFPPNSFISASIEVARRRHALTVPRSAVMIRDGKTVVLRRLQGADGKVSYEPAEVAMGVESGGDVEILSGLKAGEPIVVSGGIGLLFPEFKAADDD